MTEYVAQIQYVPEMMGQEVYWAWHAQIGEKEKVQKYLSNDRAEIESVGYINMHSETSFDDKQRAADDARDTIEAYLKALQQDNREVVTFTV